MTDREKIIKYFEICRVKNDCSADCPYWDNFSSARACTKELAKDVLTLLKEQEGVVRCKDCKYLIDHYGFMDDGYCRKMREEYYVKFKPDKNWYCADGKREEGR